jgi:hypothetical protein
MGEESGAIGGGVELQGMGSGERRVGSVTSCWDLHESGSNGRRVKCCGIMSWGAM